MSDENPLRQLLDAFGIKELPKELESELVALETEFASVGGLAGVFAGREPPPPPPQPNPAFAFPDPPLAAGIVEYAVTDERDGTSRAVSPVRIESSAASGNGQRVWGVAMRLFEHDAPVQWDVAMRAADLRPITCAIEWSLLRIEGRAIGDHLYLSGNLAPKHGGRSSRHRLPEVAFLSPGALWAALAAAPLGPEWSASAALLHRTPPKETGFVPLRLQMAGEERLRTAIGEVDCWIVSAEGSADGNVVSDRIWVSRDGDPARRVVVRVLEQKAGGAKTRRWELASMQREAVAQDAAAGAARAEPAASPTISLEVVPYSADARSLGSIPLRRGRLGRKSSVERREFVERQVKLSTIEQLRARGAVPARATAEGIARYERERAECLADWVAYLEAVDAKREIDERTIDLGLILQPTAEEASATYLRLTVPPQITVRIVGEDIRLASPLPPLRIDEPIERRRKRFDPRLLVSREIPDKAFPSERFVAPDGSTVVVHGPAPASRKQPATFQVRFVFESWEGVAPFTVAYDISAEGMAPVHGTFVVGARLAT